MVTPKWAPTKGGTSRTSAAGVPISTVSHCRSRLSQETLQHQQVGLVQSPVGSLLLAPGSWCVQDFVCAFRVSVSQSCESPVIKSCWSSKSDSLVLLPDSQAGKPDMGLRTFTTVGELPRLWAAYPAVMGFDFTMAMSLLLSRCGFSFVFGRGVSFFGGFQHPPVGGCSITTCTFGVLTKGDECTSFYSASLYLDFKFYHPFLQHYSKLACNFQNR